MKQTKLRLRTIPRIIAIILLMMLFTNIYSLLGYSSEWYELAGWMIEFCIGTSIYCLLAPFSKRVESWIRSW